MTQKPQEKNIKNYVSLIIYLLITTVATGVFFATNGLVTYFLMTAVASAFFAMALTKGGQGIGLTYFVVVALIVFLVSRDIWYVFLVCSVFMPVGMASYISLGKKKTFNSAMATGFIAYCLFAVASILIFVYENSNPFSFEIAFEPVFGAIKEVLNQSYQILADTGVTALFNMTKEVYISTMYSQMLMMAPIFYSVAALISVLISNRIFKLLYSKTLSVEDKQPLCFANLRYFRLSIAGGVFYMVANLVYLFIDGNSEMNIVFEIFISVMGYIFIFEGIALVMSFMAIKEVKIGWRILVCILCLFLCLMPFVSLVFSLAGLLDCFNNLRRLFNGKGGKQL